jgi:hypothetical protein
LPGAAALWYLAGRVGANRREWESGMKIDPAEGHPAMDYAEHMKTYKLFLKLSAYTVVIVAIILAGLTLFVV